MNPKQFLSLSPERRLIMTYALGQSLEILQMNQQELAQWLQTEIEKNPLLELNGEQRAKRYESEVVALPTLYEHIQNQIRENFPSKEDQYLAQKWAELLDEKGFISSPLDSCNESEKRILSILQTFDPPGIFARSLQESFLIQLKAKGKKNSLSYKIIEAAFEELLHGRYGAIKKKLNVTDLSGAISELSRLSFRPAHAFKQQPASSIQPDLIISQIDGGWTLELVEDELPKFQINESYSIVDPETHEELQALRELKTSAKWISRSLERRRKLLRDLGKILLCRQAAYLGLKGPLAQLTIKELAEKLQVHESTLSRALAGKYASTPRGIIPLRSLVSSVPEKINARQLLEKLVKGEDKKNPFTDEQLAKELTGRGYLVARRTVAKYRGELKIGSATQRKNGAQQRNPDLDGEIKSPSQQPLRSTQLKEETLPGNCQ